MKRDRPVEYEVKSEVQPSSLNEEIQLDLGNGHHEIQLDRDDSQPAEAISKAAEPKPCAWTVVLRDKQRPIGFVFYTQFP